jgi:hypothetical protein
VHGQVVDVEAGGDERVQVSEERRRQEHDDVPFGHEQHLQSILRSIYTIRQMRRRRTSLHTKIRLVLFLPYVYNTTYRMAQNHNISARTV